MRRIKAKLAVLLVFALVLSGISVGMIRANAENALTVYGEAITATTGKEIKVPVMVKDNHGVVGLALKVTYDAAVMTPVKAEKGNLITSLSNLQFGDTIANHAENSFECVAYNDSNFTNNGELFVLTFKVADDATAGSHTLKLELTEHYDETLADIEVGCEDITITVGNADPTGTPDATGTPDTSTKPQATPNAENPMTVYGKAVTATTGQEIKVPVMVKDNHGVAGLALKVTYDAAVMTPVKAEKGNLITSLSNLQFGDTIANHAENNFECVAYNDSNFTNNGELFVLTFKVADDATAGSHTLKLELTEHYDETLADIEAGCEDITITVGNADPTGTPDTSTKPRVTPKPQKTPKPQATPKPKKKTKHKVTKKPGRVKIKKIKNTGKGRAKVTWGKVNCNNGYWICYCSKKNFSGKDYYEAFVSKSKKTYTIKGKSKKTYYVKVCAESYGYASKYDEDKTFMFGKWSKVKKIKLK